MDTNKPNDDNFKTDSEINISDNEISSTNEIETDDINENDEINETDEIDETELNSQSNEAMTVVKNVNKNKKDVENKLPINKRALPINAETYMLETFKENIMIIFNHEFVDGYDQRKGTDKDAKALEDTFSKFGFKVMPYKDKYRIEVGQLMKDFSEQDFTNYGCVAIAILTHGSERGGLRARDHKYREQQILEYILKNPTMATKPIIYIIQACRGGRRQDFHAVYAKKDNIKFVAQYKLPQDADIILLQSTFKDKYSYRDEKQGSWFIQVLCQKINELADKEDFESIMVSVRREVAIHKENKIKNLKTNLYDYDKQMPVTESTLIRKLYLIRKEELESVEVPVFHNYVDDIVNIDGDEREDKRIMIEYLDCEICPKICLERFDYVFKCLTQYIADNPKDSKAKTLLVVAKPCMYSKDDNAKIEMAKLLRDFFSSKASDDKYKLVYVWDDFEDE